MKYKVGDIVEIKTWKEMQEEFEHREDYIDCDRIFTSKMEEIIDNCDLRILKIKQIIEKERCHYYICDMKKNNVWELYSFEDSEIYFKVSNDMIKSLYNENHKIKFEFEFKNESL